MAGPQPVRYLPYTITTPAFTARTAPLSTPLGVSLVTLLSVQIMLPPGHSGLTGIRLDTSGGTILPFSPTPAWITGDGRDILFDLDVQSDDRMVWFTYNDDVNVHAHYLLLKVVDLAERAVTAAAIPSLVGLSG